MRIEHTLLFEIYNNAFGVLGIHYLADHAQFNSIAPTELHTLLDAAYKLGQSRADTNIKGE